MKTFVQQTTQYQSLSKSDKAETARIEIEQQISVEVQQQKQNG